MKNIIIIIALFLVSLTAKADWVKSGELDSLYLGDAPITFSKYSPDYTKFVTYSAQDSTLRLWDLGTGKVIKERTFDVSYKFDMCEYEFSSEKFVFAININEDLKGVDRESIYFNYISFTDSLKSVLVSQSGVNYKNGSIVTFTAKARGLFTLKSKYKIFTELSRVQYNGGSTYSTIDGGIIILEINKDSIIKKSFGSLSLLSFEKYSNGTFLYGSSQTRTEISSGGIKVDTTMITYGYNIDFGDASKFLYFIYDNYTENTNYPYFVKGIYSLDVNFNYLVFGDLNGKVNFYSKDLDTLTHLRIPFKTNQIRKLKLIHSQRYSMFFKELNKLLICDNQENQILDTIELPEGNLGYKEDSSIVFSHKSNTIYKTNLKLSPLSFADIFSNKKVYFKGEKILIKSIIPDNISDFKITINDSSFFQTSLNLDLKVGYYNVNLYYKELGIQNIVRVDSMFQVVDSLRATYKVTHNFNNNAKYPFHCEAFPTDTSAKIKWSYSWCVTTNDKTGKPIMTYYSNSQYGKKTDLLINRDINIKNTPLLLNISNSFQNIEYKIEINVLPNLNISSFQFRGTSPFNFKAIFESTYITHSRFGSYYECINESYNKQLIIGDKINITKPGNTIDTLNLTIDKPGIYPITMKYLNYLGGITVVHDSVITVLNPTDIQDFAERKYIFKQDADGIYCQLEGEGEVSLYDNVGRLVRTYQIENERYIRKEDLERGVYFLSIQTNGSVYHEKVLVE